MLSGFFLLSVVTRPTLTLCFHAEARLHDKELLTGLYQPMGYTVKLHQARCTKPREMNSFLNSPSLLLPRRSFISSRNLSSVTFAGEECVTSHLEAAQLALLPTLSSKTFHVHVLRFFRALQTSCVHHNSMAELLIMNSTSLWVVTRRFFPRIA